MSVPLAKSFSSERFAEAFGPALWNKAAAFQQVMHLSSFKADRPGSGKLPPLHLVARLREVLGHKPSNLGSRNAKGCNELDVPFDGEAVMGDFLDTSKRGPLRRHRESGLLEKHIMVRDLCFDVRDEFPGDELAAHGLPVLVGGQRKPSSAN